MGVGCAHTPAPKDVTTMQLRVHLIGEALKLWKRRKRVKEPLATILFLAWQEVESLRQGSSMLQIPGLDKFDHLLVIREGYTFYLGVHRWSVEDLAVLKIEIP